MSQPQPTPTTGEPIWDAVIADMQARDAIGRERYGTPLQAHNGRKALQDAYEEALDLAVYLKQEIIERKDNEVSKYKVGDVVKRISNGATCTVTFAAGKMLTLVEHETGYTVGTSAESVEFPSIDFASIKPGDDLTIRVKALRVDVDDGDCHVTAWTGESESIWINRDDIVSHDPLPRPATASEFYAMSREQQERWLAEVLKGDK